MTAPDLTLIYIVEPPDYQILACTLLASIRNHFPAFVRAIGYCPEEKMPLTHPVVRIAHEKMGAEIRPMRTEGIWDTLLSAWQQDPWRVATARGDGFHRFRRFRRPVSA